MKDLRGNIIVRAKWRSEEDKFKTRITSNNKFIKNTNKKLQFVLYNVQRKATVKRNASKPLPVPCDFHAYLRIDRCL